MGMPANAEFLENNYQGSHESLHHGGGTFKFLSLPVSKGNLNVTIKGDHLLSAYYALGSRPSPS